MALPERPQLRRYRRQLEHAAVFGRFGDVAALQRVGRLGEAVTRRDLGYRKIAERQITLSANTPYGLAFRRANQRYLRKISNEVAFVVCQKRRIFHCRLRSNKKVRKNSRFLTAMLFFVLFVSSACAEQRLV